MPFAYIAMTIRSLDFGRAYDIVKIMTEAGRRRTELIWTLVARTAYSDARMGAANAMAYASICSRSFSPSTSSESSRLRGRRSGRTGEMTRNQPLDSFD